MTPTLTAFDPFAAGEILRVSPATWPQKEIIASAKMSDEANTAFNEALSIAVDGDLSPRLLAQCFERLIERHDILRAAFSRKGDQLCLYPAKPLHLVPEDLRLLTPDKQQAHIRELWRAIAGRPMNLEEGPLFFAHLLQLADRRWELILAVHHVVCDGWSFGVLLKELTSLYRQEGTAGSLPPAPSFFDYADQSAAREVANADIDYWRERFGRPPPALEMPLDFTRPPLRSFQARRCDHEFDRELVKRLPKAAAHLKASQVHLVLAGWFALLHRLTGSGDLVVGLPVAGQAAGGRLNQVGHMVQLLPIRIAVEGGLTLAELVARVKSEVLDAGEHPDFTFGKLLEKMVVDRSRVPLIATLFNIDQPLGELNFGTAKGSVRSIPRVAENFEIFLNLVPSGERLTVEATYSTALFSEPTIAAWLHSLEYILRQAVADPQRSISELSLAAALPEVLKQSNATAVELRHGDFLRAFSEQVKKKPQAPAVICGAATLTYRQLDRLSSDMAARLQAGGVGEGQVVGLCCRRSEKMVAALLAIFKAGAAYLPLAPDFPNERLLLMLQDSGAAALLFDAAAPLGLLHAELPRFELDQLAQPVGRPADSFEPPHPDPRRPAYLIYTSGSTGKPKGVRVHHHALINFLESMAREPGCTDHDRLLAVTTLSFDISALELFLPLICGAATVIADQQQARDGDALAGLIAEHAVTLLQATPSTWRLLLGSRWKDAVRPGAPKLKALCGGEPLPPDLSAALSDKVSELWNMFGPTETTVWSTCKRIGPDDPLISVGQPIANTQIYVLDSRMQPLPLSAPGELYIGGAGVALGYHNRPALNAERFIEHPEYGRIYRTGDQAKVLPGGEIQHLGRLDDQVKLRGYRIELGEIEAALLSCGEVRAAAVYLWERSAADVRIVACYVPASSDGFQSSAIRRRLRAILPGYMVPQYLLAVPQIPQLANGKVDRRGLPRPEVSESLLTAAGSPPASESEKTIARIWAELIKPKEPICREDNFFEIGGHSLLALEAILIIEEISGARLSMADFVTQNLANLAAKIPIRSEMAM